MDQPEVEIRIVKELPDAALRELADLYGIAGFTDEGDDPALWLDAVLSGSLLAAGVFRGEQLIGFGRALGDGVSDAYLQDIVIHPDFRGRGLGARLVHFLIAELRKTGTAWIGIVAVPGKEDFYRKLGFTPLARHTPMRFEADVCVSGEGGDPF